MHILFLVPYPPGKAPSQRFRFEQYLHFLPEADHTYQLESFISEEIWAILYKPGHGLTKALGIIGGFLRRLLLLAAVPKADFVFIHREASPIGPPVFEWIIAKLFGKRIVYDFDDAIWIPNTSAANSIVAGVKWHHKVGSICRWAYKISCGNSYLRDYARQFNPNAVVNPTTIDTVNLHNQVKDQRTDKLVIGWTGTHSTMKYLEQVVPVLARLEQHYDFEFRVISNQEPQLPLRSLGFRPWRKDTEIADLLTFNVGLMPLEDDPWAKGKCAFKALQYMALGVPALVSPVGMNSEVVTEGVDGYICATPEQWYNGLEKLLRDHELRTRFGQAARATIEARFSVLANRDNFLALFA
ncbi:Glycosyltransferase involved in cell wall bisynthesis [Hymenobacter daecheongensis DSM 21074]|uniref:Glycosyltransferase involved in cell wall bisynthesis n=1 Tax=Hymenobacter daecheongensis DSM 21074 TaxID=1121955 RepID=A0A1M6GFB0_9BACT|nr:glycosyltransferase family 4 protein [Hymenobacter daecheongensis]SHJ08598.1 Glycosyltransferase involved in cell wall bisynthesis [Hymenobacter daecheongensis DSM 21074]